MLTPKKTTFAVTFILEVALIFLFPLAEIPLTINVSFNATAFAQDTGAVSSLASSNIPVGLENDSWKKREKEFNDEHKDSTGKVRPDLWRVGIKKFRQMKIAAGVSAPTGRSVQSPSALSALGGGVLGVQWTQIGPQPLRIDKEQIYQGAGPDSGLVTDIAIDPRNTTDQTVYISVNDGGIWKTTDGGLTWKPKADFMPSLSMGAVALDPSNPSIVYAGTGNKYDPGGIFFKGVGIYRSIDSGETWAHLNPNSLFDNVGINRMRLPSSGVLLVATDSGLFRSVDNGLHFGNNAPSFDNGVPVLNGYISDLALDTASSAIVYASVYGQGILVSTDSGATFPAGSNLFNNTGAPAAASYSFIAFSQSTMESGSSNSNVMYALVQDYDSVNNKNLRSARLFRSPDNGTTWTEKPSAADRSKENGGCQCGYDQTVGVDPQDPNRVYIGFQELYLSTDGGDNFTTPAITRNKVHWDQHAIVFSPPLHWGSSPAPPTKVWIGTDGGVSSSTDGGSNWSNLNETIATQHIHHLDIGRGSDYNNEFSYAGSWDTGTLQHRPDYPGNDWHEDIDGDGGAIAVSPNDPNTAYGGGNNGFIRTTDGGSNWGGPSATSLPSCGSPTARKYVNAEVVDPNNGSAVFVSSGCSPQKFYRSTDGGDNFSLIGTFSRNVTAVGTVKPDSNTQWVGLNDGTLQRTANVLDSTPTWTSITVTGAPGNQPVAAIAINPLNTSEVVVVYPGFCGNACPNKKNRMRHVFRTADNGVNWDDISGTDGNPSGNLPDLPVHSVVIDSGPVPPAIIISNDAGVLRSANIGATWEVLGVGLPTVDSKQLALDDSATPSLLRIGTYGRSTFELTAATGPLLAVNADLGFGAVCLDGGETRIVQLFNVGSTDLHISSFFRASGSADFKIISGPSTPVTIMPGEEIDYTIQFKPTTAGDEVATFQINSDDPFDSAHQLFASGTGITAKIATSIADSGNFGDVCVGSFKDLPLTINNPGGCDLSVTGINSNTSDFIVPNATFPLTIGPGSSAQVSIRFQPTSLGPKSGKITITSSAPTSPTTVDVLGNAPSGKISVSGSTTFGDVCAETLAEKTISVCNVGACILHVTSASLGTCTDFQIINNPFPNNVSHDACLGLTIRFTPTSAGPKPCTLTITSDDPDTSTVTLQVTGNTPQPTIDISPDIAFPPTVIQSIGSCQSLKPFPISNTGICNLRVTSISNSGDFSFSGLPSFPVILQAGHIVGEGNMKDVFKPTAIDRDLLGTITVTYESDPITHNTTSVTRQECGEGVRTGARVLVTAGGVPLSHVDKIQIQRITGNKNKPILNTVDVAQNLSLMTVTPTPPCPPFNYHREYGTVSNPIQLLPGSYQVTASAIVNGKRVSKTVGFSVDTCGFNPNIMIGF